MKPSALRTAIPRLLAKHRAPFLWGAPGVGKSDLVAQIASDMGAELRDVRISLLDPIDLKGFPVVDAAKKFMEWLPADFLPPMQVKEGAKMVQNPTTGVLFLDEMNSAPQSVQAAAYQLVLNRKIGAYELPAGWSVIAAGNRTSDRSVVHAQPAALANRFIHLDYDVSVDDWSVWAAKNGIHSDLRAFIRFRPNLLHDFKPADNPRAFPSPRSWAFVNDVYQDHNGHDVEFELIKGTVGEGACAEFSAFVRLIKDLPTPDQILMDPEGTRLPVNPAAQYAIATAMDSKVTEDNIERVLKYMIRLPTEFQVLFMRGALRSDNALTGTKPFQDWALKNQDVLL